MGNIEEHGQVDSLKRQEIYVSMQNHVNQTYGPLFTFLSYIFISFSLTIEFGENKKSSIFLMSQP